MSGLGDDKSIEPAHQSYVPPYTPPSVTGGPPGVFRIADVLTEERVRRIAEEVGAKLVADLEARLAARDDAAAVQEAISEEPPRETGWAVVLDGQLPTVLIASRTRVAFTPLCAGLAVDIRWLGCRADAEALARLLCIGRAAELDKETLKEVE